MPDTSELTEDEIQKRLAGEAFTGPRIFRGKTLAPLTSGLRSILRKVSYRDDDPKFRDFQLLRILAAAHAETDAEKVTRRAALLAETDDIAGYRASANVEMDALTPEDEKEAWRLVNEILGIVESAEVTLAEKKSASDSESAVTPSPTPMPSMSGPSPDAPAGLPIISDGNSPCTSFSDSATPISG